MLCLEPRLVFRLLEGVIYRLEPLVVGDIFDKRLDFPQTCFNAFQLLAGAVIGAVNVLDLLFKIGVLEQVVFREIVECPRRFLEDRELGFMLMSNVDLKSYTDTAYHNEELKSLTRYRFDKVRERAQLKQSVSRLVTILFPELEKLVPTLHMSSIYALLIEFPGAKQITEAHLTHLKSLLKDASKGRYGRDMATEIRDAAKHSIGSVMPAKSLELRHTIRLIRELDSEIEDIEAAIEAIMEELQSPITTIPGMGFRMGAMILAEIGDFARFDSPDKILAYAGMSPSTYQSGQLSLAGTYSHMEKRGSRYLRYALYNATKYVCHWDPGFAA